MLLHGWMDAGAGFQFLVDALPTDWEVVAPDWRGFGKSEWASGTYYFPEYLADLDALLAHLSPAAPVWLVGHSMGGNVASLYAGIRPERVARLVSLEGLGLQPASPSAAPAHYRAWLAEQHDRRAPRTYADWASLIERLRRGNPASRRNAPPSSLARGRPRRRRVRRCAPIRATSCAVRCCIGSMRRGPAGVRSVHRRCG